VIILTSVHPYSEVKSVFPELEVIQGKYKVVNTINNVKDFFQKGHAYTTSFNAESMVILVALTS
jgi:hypothetical protein